MRTQARIRRRRLLEAVLTRTLKVPPGTHDYTLAGDVRVPMRDGVELLTDVYRPIAGSRGTILIRTPYGRATPIALISAGFYAGHGYRVVNQSCRGTFGSGGNWWPFVTEIDDGADTVEWLRTQPWFDGRFALCGASYLGFTSWAIMTEPPPELACAVIAISAHDNYRVTYGEGAFALEGSLSLRRSAARRGQHLPGTGPFSHGEPSAASRLRSALHPGAGDRAGRVRHAIRGVAAGQ